MYTPPLFREPDAARARELMRRHPFATLVSAGPDGLEASHLPVIVREGPGLGTIVGHMARANPLWRQLGGEVLAIFGGPHAYISPNWYARPDANVPTWNYVAIHAYGPVRTFEDPTELRALLEEEVALFEEKLEPRWGIGQLPPEKVESLLGAIVGFSVEIQRFDAKLKLGQNRETEDRVAAERALAGRPDEASRAIAAWMRAVRQEA
jgi:transcriptional regulator